MANNGTKKTTPLRAIRLNCLECSVGSPKEVRLCPITRCSLYRYRFGRDPSRKGKGGLGNIENLRRHHQRRTQSVVSATSRP